MKINYLYITFVLAFLFILSNVSASETDCAFSIPTVKQGTCVNLIQTCSNCSEGINITAIYYPQINGTILYPNAEMTQNRNNYNYTFCDTLNLGTYIYSTEGAVNGIPTTGNICFSVTPTGDNPSGVQGALYFIPLIVFTFLMIFFSNRFFYSSNIAKVPYFLLAYFIGLLPLAFSIYTIVQSYLPTLTFMTNITYYFFLVILIASPFIFLGSMGYFVYIQLNEVARTTLIQRGHDDTSATRRIQRRK